MSWSTPKLPASESRKGLLSSPKTLFGTPSTVNNQGQSPEVDHHHDRMGSFGLGQGDTDEAGRRSSVGRSKFSTFASTKRSFPDRENDNPREDDTDLDRDQVLQPDYGRAKHISSMFQTNPMLNLYSDDQANATAAGRAPFDSPSSPPHVSGGMSQIPRPGLAAGAGGLGEEDEIDLRPPPSVHDPYVASQKASMEQLRRRLEAERTAAATSTLPRQGPNGEVEVEAEMNSSIAMQEQLAKIFDLQMQLADMHGAMEGINEVVRDEHENDDEEKPEDDGQETGKGKAGEQKDLSKSPKVSVDSPKKKAGQAAKSPKSARKELGGDKSKGDGKEDIGGGEAVDQPGVKREKQIGDIVTKLSDLSTLLHQFHSMPHPNLDSAFPPSPASANSGTFKQNFNDLQEATKASGRSQAGRVRERAQGAA
ncbi:hypothetical protein FFLO_03475 [Filobasidium floriforme]|uniref:Uncharacterized protein n=1 Tax=Filobasidium floriforme TaxID=5210 RepID=A0A8K0JKM4_9TREE|nr:hypothetical protein FFLO_03475 [Filobasidium floriforme]